MSALAAVKEIISSLQVFRPKIVNEEFIKNLSSLLSHIRSIESGETNIEGASGKGVIRLPHLHIKNCI